MIEWRERITLSLVLVVLLISGYTVLYQWAMLAFEGVSITITAALQVAVEVLTTAGLGGDAEHWNSHAMNLLVVGMNLTGVLLVFLALPLFVVPLFQEAFENGPPESIDLTDHVVICSYTPREDVLRSELDGSRESLSTPRSSAAYCVTITARCGADHYRTRGRPVRGALKYIAFGSVFWTIPFRPCARNDRDCSSHARQWGIMTLRSEDSTSGGGTPSRDRLSGGNGPSGDDASR